MKLYVRTIGTDTRWLRVRDIQKKLFDTVLEVNVRGKKKFLNFPNSKSPANLEFRLGEWPDTTPCSWDTVCRYMVKDWIET